jgi:glutamate N-acetyltransferase/amino-acid N-acetyltransferase
VGVLAAERECPAAAVFTQNRFCGAPVTVGREHVQDNRLQAIVVNSGCANVATGQRGINDARRMCRWTAEAIDSDEEQVLPASTGVIGEFLPMDKLQEGIRSASNDLSSSAAAGKRFARAILTTDTKIKQAGEKVRVGKDDAIVAGCCKGSGMIAPNMATMLGFITTDAQVPVNVLRKMLSDAVEETFNRVTVDECQSTSDMVVMLASGQGAKVATKTHRDTLASSLYEVCDSLAYQIAADGEGATRVLEVVVTSARSAGDAHTAARAVAVSPLVKTAVHGGDPNWGRIVQALGAAEVCFDLQDVVVRLGGAVIFRNAAPARALDKPKVARLMRKKDVRIEIDLGAGRYTDRVRTCDLSRDYITINADYHT